MQNYKYQIYKCSVSLLFLMSASAVAHAQEVDVNKINANSEGTTTIQIRKEKNDAPTRIGGAKWQVHDGSSDIEGDSSATEKEAKKAWGAACDKWKTDFRADNKENKIINISCGRAVCEGEAGSKVCVSKATYTVKTPVD